MSGLLKRVFGPKQRPIPEVEHPILGKLTYAGEDENWGKHVALAGQEFRLSVGGEQEPDPVLLSRAAALQADLPTLLGNLPAFLEEEARAMPHLAEEIRSLAVADVAVWWPKQPDAVMIWFNGPSEERIWHCDYSGGALKTLAFDC